MAKKEPAKPAPAKKSPARIVREGAAKKAVAKKPKPAPVEVVPKPAVHVTSDEHKAMTEAELVDAAESADLVFTLEAGPDGGAVVHAWSVTDAGRKFLSAHGVPYRGEIARHVGSDLLRNGADSEYAELVDL